MKWSELSQVINYPLEKARDNDFQVSGVFCNSKEVIPNGIFVAVQGNKEDGAKYIEEALRYGAKVILTRKRSTPLLGDKSVIWIETEDERVALARLACAFYGYPANKLEVIGVTGTNGKTTVTYLMEAVLKAIGQKCGVIGTVNYRFGQISLTSTNTTPGPLQLQEILAKMVDSSVKYCVMEVSSHALAQKRVEGIDFKSAIFTNLSHEHLDYHKSIEEYFNAKAQLFVNLSTEAFAIINNDDSFGQRLTRMTKAKIIRYGIDNDAEVRASDIQLGVKKTEFTVEFFGQKKRFFTCLIGKHNIYNILAVYSWLIAKGLSIKVMDEVLTNFQFVPGRLQPVSDKEPFAVFVDYAHTDAALEAVLNSLRKLTKGRLIVVFGCGGDRDKTKRPKMGRVATEIADKVIITTDNPRSEDPQEIINDILKGITSNNFSVIIDRQQAIAKAIEIAQEKDVILIAGKGHENYQIYKDKIIPFNDCEVAKRCLLSRNCLLQPQGN